MSNHKDWGLTVITLITSKRWVSTDINLYIYNYGRKKILANTCPPAITATIIHACSAAQQMG
jgi:hypothetical protein